MIPPSTPASPPIFRIKAPRQPMLWAVVAYSSGIVAGVYQWRPALWWVVAGVAFIAAALYFAQRRELQTTAHVTRDGRLRQGGLNELKQTVDIETEQIQTATGQNETVHSGI